MTGVQTCALPICLAPPGICVHLRPPAACPTSPLRVFRQKTENSQLKTSPAFTLIELLVVIAIIAILAAILVADGPGRIGPHARNPGVFKCPSDRSRVVYKGQLWIRARSYSQNNFINPQMTWERLTDFTSPGPSGVCSLIDQHGDSLVAPHFNMSTGTRAWTDLPGSRHNGAGVLAFVDGHVETHRWLGESTKPPEFMDTSRYYPDVDERDWRWLGDRTSPKVR